MNSDAKKMVLITGSSGNLGKVTVQKFLDEGYGVIAIVSPGKKEAVKFSGKVEVYESDLSDEKMTRQVVKNILEKHKKIHAALLLAGGFDGGSMGDTGWDKLVGMFSLNLLTAYSVARPVFDHMKNQPEGGRIILIGARAALEPLKGKDYLAYSLSKSTLFKLAEFMNAEGASSNIITSVIVPGTIDTPQNRTAMPSTDFTKWVSAEEIAAMMAFLCSPNGRALREPVLKLYGKG